MTQVSCGGYTCVGLKSNGLSVAWGNITNGGDTQGKDFIQVAHATCGVYVCCVGLKSNGDVVA